MEAVDPLGNVFLITPLFVSSLVLPGPSGELQVYLFTPFFDVPTLIAAVAAVGGHVEIRTTVYDKQGWPISTSSYDLEVDNAVDPAGPVLLQTTTITDPNTNAVTQVMVNFLGGAVSVPPQPNRILAIQVDPNKEPIFLSDGSVDLPVLSSDCSSSLGQCRTDLIKPGGYFNDK